MSRCQREKALDRIELFMFLPLFSFPIQHCMLHSVWEVQSMENGYYADSTLKLVDFLYFNHHCHQPRHNGSSDGRGRAKAAEVNGQNWEDGAVGGGELEEYRNTAGNRSPPPPASYCLPPQTLLAFARLQTDLLSDHRPCHNWPLAQACTQKSTLPPPF